VSAAAVQTGDRFPPGFVSDVNRATPLRDLVGRRVQLERAGRLWTGCCPFHAEKTPSFTIYPDNHFHCFGCGAHGTPIQFLQRAEGLTFAEARHKLAAEAGLEAPTGNVQQQRERAARLERERAEREAKRAAAEAAQRAEVITRLQERVERLVPAAGTLAERYLVETRSIPRPSVGWPDVIRYDARAHALVVVATNAAGETQAAQWVHLTTDATKAEHTKERPTKLTRGPVTNSAVRLPGRIGTPLLVAEGPETGLSVWVATGCETWIALGSIGNLPVPPTGRDVVVCLDDDARHKPAARLVRKALARWRLRGVTCVRAKPWAIRREDGSDFNDVLREHGAGAVEERILLSLEPEFNELPALRLALTQRVEQLAEALLGPHHSTGSSKGQWIWPSGVTLDVTGSRRGLWCDLQGRSGDPLALIAHRHGLSDHEAEAWARKWSGLATASRAVPVAIARERARQLSETWLTQILAGAEPAPILVGMGAGGGKSEVFIRAAILLVKALRERGDTRNVFYGTPRIELHDSLAARAREIAAEIAPALRIAVYRGASAPNPDRPNETMCVELDALRAAQRRLLDPAKTICPGCSAGNTCGTNAQRSREADIWFGAHNMPHNFKPRAIGKLAARITDENPIGPALIGVGDPDDPDSSDPPLRLTLDTFRRADRTDDAVDTERLIAARKTDLLAFETMPDGPLQRAALIAAGITTDLQEQAIYLEYATKVEPAIEAGMTFSQRVEAIKTADVNSDLGRRVMYRREIVALLRSGQDVSSRIEIATVTGTEGPVRQLRMRGVRSVKREWLVPTAVLDATPQPTLLRSIMPSLVRHDVGERLTAPHRHITQIADRAFSLAMLDDEAPSLKKLERARRANNLKRVHTMLCRQILDHSPGRILIVAQKRIVERLQALGPFPGTVEWAHFGAVTGLDQWGDVRLLIVVGRPMPPPAAMERAAEALTGATVERLPGWYPMRDAVHQMTGGTQIATEAVFHPDPIAESFRWRACEGEVIQTIERGRGVNRQTDAERLDVLVLNDLPLGLPIDRLISTEEVPARAEDRMLVSGGVALSSAEHGSIAYPTIWPNGSMLRSRLKRERDQAGDKPWQPPAGFHRVEYRLSRIGSHWETADYDPAVVSDIRVWLTNTLGPLAELSAPQCQPPQEKHTEGTDTEHPVSPLPETPATSPPPPLPPPPTLPGAENQVPRPPDG
jgi:CHC2 zinc finger/Toprim domain